MANPGYMAQIAQGESSGNASAVGHDPGGTEGLGLWQITTGYNDDLIARMGGREAMFDPLKNARAAASILANSGTGAWYAPPTGPRGKVNQALAQKIQAAMSGQAVAGDGAGTKKRDYEYGLARNNFAVAMPGLRPTPIPKAARAAAGLLPQSVQAMLRQPGLTAGEQISIGENALADAEATVGYDDDIAAAQFLKPFLQAKEKRQQKDLKKLNKELRQGGENENQRKRNLERRKRLREGLSATRSGIRGLDDKIKEAKPTDRDYADLDLARAEGTTDRGDDIAALQKLVDISEKELKKAEKSGDPREIAEATRNLKAAADALRDATPTPADFANRDLALAELTEGTEDDKAALEKLKSIAQQQLDAALQTADPRDDIEAAQNLKGVIEALKALEVTIQQSAQEERDLYKQQAEERERAYAMSQSQYGVLARAITEVVSGQIGGRVGLGFQTPSVAGSLANY
jgi:transglycosylase-like protein with SLT domain